MTDDYRQGQLDILAAVHNILADIGMELTNRPAADEPERLVRTAKLEALLAVSRRVTAMPEAATA